MKRTKKRAARVAQFFFDSQLIKTNVGFVALSLFRKLFLTKSNFLILQFNERSLPEAFTFFCNSDGNFKIMQTTLL